jgi:SAM-dependent methyltransferase
MFSSAKTLAKSVLPAPVLFRTRTIWRGVRSVIDPLRHPKRGLELVYRSMRDLPYKLSLATAWPGSYLSKLPDRYYGHYPKYVAGGGQMRFGDLSKFTRKNRLNTADLSRFYFFNLILDQVLKEQLAGDVAELGVYKGNTAFLLTKLVNLLGRTVYLFDTFEGFSSNDLCGIDANKLPEFADTSLASVRALIGDENVRFIKGRFPASADLVEPNLSFCLVHLDCDLYVPFRAALDYFYPRLVPGGFLIMHDYLGLYWDGVEKAVDEFFADKPEKVVPIPDKSGTVVIRKLCNVLAGNSNTEAVSRKEMHMKRP